MKIKLYIFEQSENCQTIEINIALNASFFLKNSPKYLAAGALPQTPLTKLTTFSRLIGVEILRHPLGSANQSPGYKCLVFT